MATVPGALLRVSNLKFAYEIPVLAGITFEVQNAESVGLFGESGSGKTTLLSAIPGLLPKGGTVGGSILFRDRELCGQSERSLREIRGAQIALIHQEPGDALNPVMRAGTQVSEVARAHRKRNRGDPEDSAREAMAAVDLAGERFFRAYPHELSGGQQQRVLIALAIVCRPALLLADEPTSSLDSETEAGILALLRNLQAKLGLAILIASHDPRVLVSVASRLLVMYAGRVIETGTPREVFSGPLHPYTRALLNCVPLPDGRLPVIPGDPPRGAFNRGGCVFEPRCAQRMPICRRQEPGAVGVSPGRTVACFLYDQ